MVFFTSFTTAGEKKADEKKAKPSASKTQTPYSTSYKINPGDILYITVWKEPELSKEVLVKPDGRVSLPLAGEIIAANKTVLEINKELKGKLAKYIPDAETNVTVNQPLGNKLFVLGQVARPGEFIANQNTDILQAITKAGGLTPYADPNDIKVIRREDGKQKAIKFNYSQVIRGKKLEQNIVLKSGDVVVVP